MDGSTFHTDVFLVATEDIPAIWPEIAPLLAPACLLTRERVSIEAVHKALESGDKRLFVAVRNGKPIAAATVLIGEHENGRWAYICQAGGRDPVQWLHSGIVLIEEWAKLHNCRGVLINNAREEWARTLGYEKTGVRLEKDFGHAGR